jgi:hypothetical protein
MTLEEFLDYYSNNSSVDMEEVAVAARSIVEKEFRLALAAGVYLKAIRDFEKELDKVGFEWG